MPEIVAEAASSLTGVDVDASHGRLTYARWRPGKNCVLNWSLPDESGHPILVSAKTFADRTAEKIVARRSFRALAEVTGGLHACFPERRLLLQVFPMDFALPGLASVTSPEWARVAIASALGVPQEEVRAVEATTLRYKAWRRCVLRFSAEVQGRPIRHYAKAFRDDRGEDMLQRLRNLGEQMAARGSPWRIAAPSSYSREVRTLLFPEVEGAVELKALAREARTSARHGRALREHVSSTASGLASFREAIVDGVPRVTSREILDDLATDAEPLADVLPELALSIAGLLRDLESEADRMPPEPLGATHGALRIDQLLFCGDEPVGLDLDGLCLSGPASDPGYFLADLDRTAVRRPSLRPLMAECEKAFSSALETDHLVDPRWLAWHRAANHVKLALRCVFTISRGWPEAAEGLIGVARRTLGELAAARS